MARVNSLSSAVPFPGWSQATNRFRMIASDYANSNASVLLIGSTGAGINRMARAWRHCAGASNGVLPVVDLDANSESTLHPCIAITERKLPCRIHCLDLSSGTRRAVPKYCGTDESLSPDVVKPFVLRLHMPPLQQRPIDILAILHCHNQVELPEQFGWRYNAISSALLDAMLFDTDWNCAELIAYFTASAVRDARQRNHSAKIKDIGVLKTNPDLPYFHAGYPSRDARADNFDGSENIAIPFDELPDFAINLFSWHCMRLIDAEEDLAKAAPDAAMRLGLEHYVSNPDRLTAEVFQELTVEDFVKDVLLIGLPARKKSLSEKQKIAIESLCRKVEKFSVLDATFDSLQAGLSISPEWVAKQIKIGDRERKDVDELRMDRHNGQLREASDERLISAIEKLTANQDRPTTLAPISPKALSRKDAAKYIGVEEKTIQHLINSGQIANAKTGAQRGRVIPVESLDRFLKDRTQPTAEEQIRKRKKK